MAGREPMLDKAGTEKQVEALCENYATGASLKDSSAAAGLNYKTVCNWMTEGKKEGCAPRYKAFRDRVCSARAEGNVSRIRKIEASDDWRAHKYLLSIADPEAYAEKRQHELSGRKGEPIEIRQYDAIDIPVLEGDEDD